MSDSILASIARLINQSLFACHLRLLLSCNAGVIPVISSMRQYRVSRYKFSID